MVADPKGVLGTRLRGPELESHRAGSLRIHAVKDGRHLAASVDAGDQQQADLVNQTGLKEGPVDVPATFEQQHKTIDPAVGPDSNNSKIWRIRRNPKGLGKDGMRFRNNSNENADD